MRFMVFGAGAMGSLVAARLADAHEVSLVGRETHVDAIRRDGLRVTGRSERHQTGIHAMTTVEGAAPDVVLVTTKSYDTERAADALQSFAKDAIFVSLQNGLGNEEMLAQHAERVLGAVINHGVTFLEPGVVFHAGEGDIVLGPFHGTTVEDAERVARGFRDVGLSVQTVDRVMDHVWRKAVLNACVNPLTALLGKRTGELLGDEPLEEAMRAIVLETVAVAHACGADVDAGGVLAKIRIVAVATRDNKSSMLQDLQLGRRTEIDAINGEIVARARAHGLPVPRNELLFQLVRSAEKK